MQVTIIRLRINNIYKLKTCCRKCISCHAETSAYLLPRVRLCFKFKVAVNDIYLTESLKTEFYWQSM